MLLVIIFLGILIRIIGIGQSFWLDEAAQAVMSKGSFSSVFFRPGDFHPPIFYLMSKVWMFFGASEIWLRILPLSFGVLAIVALYFFAKKFFGEKTAILSALFLSFSPFHVYYSQTFRSYSLLVFLSILSVFFLFSKKWRAYSLINAFAFFTNYMFVFVIFSEIVYFVVQKKRKEIKNIILFHIPLLILFIFYSPQFFLQLKSGQNLVFLLPEWKNLSSPNFLIAIPLTMFKLIAGQIAIQKNPFYIFYAFVVFGMILWIFVELKKKKDKFFNFFAIFIFFPIIFAWLVSFFVPLNNFPRMIFVLPFLFLMISHFIVVSKDKHLTFIMLIILTFGVFMQNFEPINKKEDWRNAVFFVDKNTIAKKNTLVVFEFSAPFAPWQWYEKNGIKAVGAISSKANMEEIDKKLGPFLSGKKQIFLFEYFADVTDPKRLVRKYLEENQFKVINFADFNNVGFIFEFRRPINL